MEIEPTSNNKLFIVKESFKSKVEYRLDIINYSKNRQFSFNITIRNYKVEDSTKKNKFLKNLFI